MSLSPSASLLLLYNSALQDYTTQTGTNLVNHPFSKQLEKCESVDSITSLLQEDLRKFLESRREDGRIIKSLKCAVHVLHSLSISTLLGESIGLAFPPAKAVFAAFAILLQAVKDVSASYDALVELFGSIERFLSRLDIYTRIPLTSAITDVLIKILVEVLSTLAIATRQVKQGRLKKFVKKILGENDIEAVLQRLDRLTLDEARATGAQTLQVVYGLVQHRRVVLDDLDDSASADSIRMALELLQKISGDLNKSMREELQQNIRKWLSPPDPWKNHNIARESQHTGTARWWIHGEAFSNWKHSIPSSLLWLHGKPGAGKSIICSSIIQNIRSMCQLGLASLAFFYCDFREDQKRHRRGLLSSLLVQLCRQSDSYYGTLSKFYLAHDHGSQHASDSELAQCLKDLLALPGQATAYIVIDALDECPLVTELSSPREEVLGFVEELVGLHVPNVRICVTSRPEADIELVLSPLAFRSVSLHEENGQAQDIAEYVKFVVSTDRNMQKWRKEDKDLVIQELTRKAGGMFRWVSCQLQYLRHCLRQRIRRALDELPATLDGTYDRTLEEIGEQNWEYAHRLFQCVAAASRPLRVQELAEFLAFDFDTDSTPTLQEDWREVDPAHAVRSTCSSLLAIVGVGGSSVIQFAHFSVKEYLTSKRLAESKETISRFHISMTPAHAIVAQACLGVLLHMDKSITKDDLKRFPLARYAAEHWVGHARFQDVSPKIQDGMKRLFDPNNHHLSVWVWIHDPDPQFREPRSKCPSQATATPLHYAACCGLHDVAEFLIVERSQNVNNHKHRDGETPLGIASKEGHSEVARVLLEHGADTEARDNGLIPGNPLDLASQRGHLEVVQVLLEYHADLNSSHKDFLFTALHRASQSGKVEIARVLLANGADANAKAATNQTPLHLGKNDGVARVLLEYGADPNARDGLNLTPLHRAMESGAAEAARVLLENGVDANARGSQNQTPLHVASEVGYFDGVRLLLQHGADIHARDRWGQTPFKVASAPSYRISSGNYQDTMQLLLEHGAEDHRTRWLRPRGPGRCVGPP